jgi:hypothetical protein
MATSVDGLDVREVKARAVSACKKGGDWIPIVGIPIVGKSGTEWGAVRAPLFFMGHPLLTPDAVKGSGRRTIQSMCR